MSAVDRISALLRPRSIAIVGASDPSKMAGRLMAALIDGRYRGRIYPVNPRYEELAGLRCYASLADVHADVEHCIIGVPQNHVLGIIEECRRLGVKSATILTSGFAELGESGAKLQAQIKQAAGDMVFIGPNCLGFANLGEPVIATSTITIRHDPTPGDVAVISQSGGLSTSSFSFIGQQSGLQYSYFVTAGNAVGVSFGDLTEYLFHDPATRIIVVIVEDDHKLGEILSVVRRIGLQKPIVVIKCGRGVTGTRMAQSHTGALAGEYAIVEACCEQLGVVCAQDIEDAVAIVTLLQAGIRSRNANGLGTISYSGGNLTLFADAVDEAGLEFAQISDGTAKRLRDALPDYVVTQNPVDVTTFGVRNLKAYREVIEALLDDNSVGLVAMIITVVPDVSPFRDMLISIKADRPDARLVVLWNGGSYSGDHASVMRRVGIPVIFSAQTLVRALKNIHRATGPGVSARPSPARVLELPAGSAPLTESESLMVLSRAGLPVPKTEVCERNAIARAAEAVGYPIVIKSDVSETHLSDRGGVLVNIRDASDLERFAVEIARMPGKRLLVAQYLPGLELVASTFTNPAFGMILMFGSGGILADLLKDVCFCALPASHEIISTRLRNTRVGHALNAGFRGATGFDAAVEFLVKLSEIAMASSDAVTQIELNPVTVGRHGATAVDAAIIRAS